MRTIWLVVAAVLGLSAPAALAAQKADIVVEAPARTEIERILEEDNLEVERLPAQHVAAIMAGIRRGGAPLDFWTAYQAHVRAWQDHARFQDRAGSASEMLSGEASEWSSRSAEANVRIRRSFDEVERVARRYKARLPVYRERGSYN